MSLSAAEREVVISFCDEDDAAEVYTSVRPWITKLKKNSAAVLIEEGIHDGSAWAKFDVPKALVSIRSRSKVGQERSEAQKQALAKARAAL